MERKLLARHINAYTTQATRKVLEKRWPTMDFDTNDDNTALYVLCKPDYEPELMRAFACGAVMICEQL